MKRIIKISLILLLVGMAVILSGKVPELFHLIRRRQKKSKKRLRNFPGRDCVCWHLRIKRVKDR